MPRPLSLGWHIVLCIIYIHVEYYEINIINLIDLNNNYTFHLFVCIYVTHISHMYIPLSILYPIKCFSVSRFPIIIIYHKHGFQYLGILYNNYI